MGGSGYPPIRIVESPRRGDAGTEAALMMEKQNSRMTI